MLLTSVWVPWRSPIAYDVEPWMKPPPRGGAGDRQGGSRDSQGDGAQPSPGGGYGFGMADRTHRRDLASA
ncbi:hypothetical protein [Nonomuraea sp. NEAU-A123]|uniref:hypothetical protein n=1 Tax=Nonomuraea sp. NEAU-A123 TaxID=2839649 RepID=UPI001BE46CEF|nr:hypothetical protein [Nonomuraea sp. NEAU-A123]MBT2226461.1 hypothetical protein [Nonomuraea sp. NEAU-A123]